MHGLSPALPTFTEDESPHGARVPRSGHDGASPRPRRGSLITAAIVIVAIIALLAAALLSSHGNDSRTALTTAPIIGPVTSPAPPSSTSTEPTPPTTVATTAAARPAIGDGRPLLGEPTGLVLFRWESDLRQQATPQSDLERIDLDTGTRTAPLTITGSVPRIWPVPGGVALNTGDNLTILDRAGTTRCVLAASLDVVPAKTGVWVIQHDRVANSTKALWITDLTTCAVTAEVAVPPGARAVGDLDGQLVVQAAASGAYRLDASGNAQR
jgi:hypothetical protein